MVDLYSASRSVLNKWNAGEYPIGHDYMFGLLQQSISGLQSKVRGCEDCLFEVETKHADEPGMNSHQLLNAEQLLEHFYWIVPLLPQNPKDYFKLSYTVDLCSVTITLQEGL